MNEELLPCPRCGGPGVIHADHILGPNEPMYTPMCAQLLNWFDTRFSSEKPDEYCGLSISGHFWTEAEAVAAWNTRAGEDELRARVAELERECNNHENDRATLLQHLAEREIPNDVRDTIRTVLTVAGYNPAGNPSGIIDRIVKALAWLDAQPKEQP